MKDYIVVIPTYKRYDIIQNKGTLSFLKKNKIDKNKIILFVANKEEMKIYNSEVPKNLYSGKIIIGKKGIEKIIELDLSNQSKKEFQKSVEAVEQLVKKCKKLLV